jgi:hypothetical protein
VFLPVAIGPVIITRIGMYRTLPRRDAREQSPQLGGVTDTQFA